ncbi:ABC transporter permease [Photobacterium makurazakiensis]|uniref:ABC transporter permease n=1 Tax=Photobacterium makurazakiensis TaxID=2910234 RepID=UPI003D0B0269
MNSHSYKQWLGLIIPLALLLLLTFRMELLEPYLASFNQNNAPTIYYRDSFLNLIGWHLLVVLLSISTATAVAVLCGILVTRPSGKDFLPLARAVANLGQTFPPVAVLALAIPSLGFGLKPTFIALFLYGLLPIFENTVTGLQQTPKNVLEAARGMGMSSRQQLLHVELPLAMPIIIAGIRISAIVSIGTATIGSTVAAKGLGEVIIAGLLTDNMAFLLQGGIIVALIAIVVDSLFQKLESQFALTESK